MPDGFSGGGPDAHGGGLLTTALVRPEASLGRAFRRCEQLTRKNAGNFYFAFRVLGPQQRQAMYTLYAFCRIADDIVDEPGHPAEKRRGLDGLEAGLEACYAGRPRGAMFRALAQVVHRYGIPRYELQEVIEGCRMDLSWRRYPTLEDVKVYCRKVSCVIGAMTIRVFGQDPDRIPQYVENGGLAVQLTNILRDVAEDAQRDRIYLPLEDLERFGVTPESIRKGDATPAFRELMAFWVERVRSLYDAALKTPGPERHPLVPLELIQRIYRRVLEEIPAQGYDVYQRRAGISKAHKLRIVACYLLRRRLGLPA